MAVPTST